jgi:hypothetical protein
VQLRACVCVVQFLESYKSVTLDSMASAFDVGLPFLDSEISDFICAGRISAKIDKVRGCAYNTSGDGQPQNGSFRGLRPCCSPGMSVLVLEEPVRLHCVKDPCSLLSFGPGWSHPSTMLIPSPTYTRWHTLIKTDISSPLLVIMTCTCTMQTNSPSPPALPPLCCRCVLHCA